MRITHFTIMQDGQDIGNVAVREQAVYAARTQAKDTGKPVSVVAHLDGGDSREVVFNPDGTNEKIWAIDKGRSLKPAVGKVYLNRSGGKFRCIANVPPTGSPYYNQAGGSSDTAALFRNIRSGWTFVAKGIIQFIDGTIEWDHSTDGRFEDITKGE